jgi:hypothetical protein
MAPRYETSASSKVPDVLFFDVPQVRMLYKILLSHGSRSLCDSNIPGFSHHSFVLSKLLFAVITITKGSK